MIKDETDKTDVTWLFEAGETILLYKPGTMLVNSPIYLVLSHKKGKGIKVKNLSTNRIKTLKSGTYCFKIDQTE